MTSPWAALLAFVLTLPLGRLAAWGGRRWGILDHPAPRKSHARPVPTTGGLALLVGGVLAATLTHCLHPAWVLPLAAYFAIGWADDRGRLSKLHKLVFQVAASGLAVLLGLSLGVPGVLGAALSLLWLLVVLEIVNFLDGIDLITCAVGVILLAAGAGGGAGPGGGLFLACFAGAVFATSFWNASPARVFLGDAGTHVVAFLVASCALQHDGDGITALPVGWVALALLPAAIDIGWGVASKRRLGIPWTDPHRVHLYQRLAQGGWAHAAVALRYGALTCALVLAVTRVVPLWVGALLLALHLAHGVRVALRVSGSEREHDG